jgi:hypothetical protein
MRLITPYAPGSFLKPCLVISTSAVSTGCETVVFFVEALNVDHAMTKAFKGEGVHVRIQEHAKPCGGDRVPSGARGSIQEWRDGRGVGGGLEALPRAL